MSSISNLIVAMKKNLLLLLIALFVGFIPDHAETPADTSAIIHTIDGSLDEWPADKFSTDKETTIQYAVDNDAQYLFISMKVSDQLEQAKIMQMGMRLFIDSKGKRKQSTGVEFPIQKERTRSDYDGLRIMLNMDPAIKLFGFTTNEATEQDPAAEGSINMAFNWDSTNAMIIEYLVPLAMLEEEIALLQNKLISIGWKINGVEMPVASSAPSSTSLGGLPNNGISKPVKKTTPGSTPVEMERMMKEQNFWAKYTLAF
jgi:hypothetical protein